jgi:hypothetical protein
MDDPQGHKEDEEIEFQGDTILDYSDPMETSIKTKMENES